MASKQPQKTQQQQQQQAQPQVSKQKAAEVEAEKVKEYIAKQVLPIPSLLHVLLIDLDSHLVSIIPIVIPMTSMNIVTSSCQSPCSK